MLFFSLSILYFICFLSFFPPNTDITLYTDPALCNVGTKTEILTRLNAYTCKQIERACLHKTTNKLVPLTRWQHCCHRYIQMEFVCLQFGMNSNIHNCILSICDGGFPYIPEMSSAALKFQMRPILMKWDLNIFIKFDKYF